MRKPPNYFSGLYAAEERASGSAYRPGPSCITVPGGFGETEARRSVDVPVAAGLLAGVRGALNVGNDGFEIVDKQRKTCGFGAQREQLLFEIQIEGQRAGQIERQRRRIRAGEILLGASNGERVRSAIASRGRSLLAAEYPGSSSIIRIRLAEKNAPD